MFLLVPTHPGSPGQRAVQLPCVCVCGCVCVQDARVSVKACEGLVLIASIPNDSCAKHLVADTSFLSQITSRLASLYSALPRVMDPADVESVDAKWGSVGSIIIVSRVLQSL